MQRFLLLLLVGFGVRAPAMMTTNEQPWENPPIFLQHNYVLVGAARNVPLQEMRERFAPGKPLLLGEYRYYHDVHWYSGLGLQYKHFIEQEKPVFIAGEAKTEEQVFVLGRFYLENSYMWRIYYPAYLSGGFRLFYLYPLEQPFLPNSKHPAYQREFGSSLVLALNLFPSDDLSIHISAERWRGVNSRRWQGAEIAVLFGTRL